MTRAFPTRAFEVMALGVLGTGLCAGAGCHAGSAKTRSVGTPEGDVIALSKIWGGDVSACESAPTDPSLPRSAEGQIWACHVPGWSSVTVSRSAKGRGVTAHDQGARLCAFTRFGPDAVVVNTMEGKIVTEVTALLDNELFPAACLSTSFFYDRPGCSLYLFPRKGSGKARDAASALRGCNPLTP